MENKLYTLQETVQLIEQGKILVIAGDDKLLSELPDGNWIAGSNPYLQSNAGGRYENEMLYLTDFSDIAVNQKFETYDKNNIHKITTDAYSNSIIITIMPAGSEVQQEFSLRSPEYENQFINPLLGWVSGTLFDDFGKIAPTSYCGNKRYTDKAVALHLQLPENKIAILEIINAYEEQPTSPVITFPEDGFLNTECLINGENQNFYAYIEQKEDDFQLIANYSGAEINVGIIKNDQQKQIFFAAPVFKGTEYKFARKKTNDYKTYLTDNLLDVSDIKYSYSCLHNLFNFGLDNVNLGMSGVFTYGEIAYQLLNVTFVYLKISEAKA